VATTCLGRGPDHSPPSSVEVENEWSCTSAHHMLGVYGDVSTCIMFLIVCQYSDYYLL